MDIPTPDVPGSEPGLIMTTAHSASVQALNGRPWRTVDGFWTGAAAAFVLAIILCDVFLDSSVVQDLTNETHHCVIWVGLYLRRHHDGVRFRLTCISVLLPFLIAIILDLSFYLYTLGRTGNAPWERWPGWASALSRHMKVLGAQGAGAAVLTQLLDGFESWNNQHQLPPRSNSPTTTIDFSPPASEQARFRLTIPISAMLMDPVLATLTTVLNRGVLFRHSRRSSLGVVPGGVMLLIFSAWLYVPSAAGLSQRQLFLFSVMLPTLFALIAEKCLIPGVFSRSLTGYPVCTSAFVDQIVGVAAGAIGAWVIIAVERASA